MMTMQMEFLQPYRDVQYQALQTITRLAMEQRRLMAATVVASKPKTTKKKKMDVSHQTSQDKNEEMSSGMNIVPERLVQLLLMIPSPKTQDDMLQAQYLFSPPAGRSVPSPQEDDEDQDSNHSDEKGNVDGDDDDNIQASSEYGSDSSDDDDDDEQVRNSRPIKRLKQDESASTSSNWDVTQAKCHRRVLSRAWLAVLQLPLPMSALKQVLLDLPTRVLSLVPQPLRFSDFLLQAYDSHQQDSGIISILALEGLFLLITQHGLEYANFYQQLYRLITPQLFQVKFRTRFLQLLDKCLSRNDKLPSQIVASFIKRLCRTALLIPPASILFVLALCSNLLQQHKECVGLIHRSPTVQTKNIPKDNDDDLDRCNDVFDAAIDDPSHTNALQSSLWELHALERHYHPAVATMAQAIGRPDISKAPLHDLNDFVKLTYQALLEQEHQHAATQRKKQKTVPITFVAPTSLFWNNSNEQTGSDVFAAIVRSVTTNT